MYLLTMGWFLAHTSLAMTPEHSATNGEYSSLRSARAGHSKSMNGKHACPKDITVVRCGRLAAGFQREFSLQQQATRRPWP